MFKIRCVNKLQSFALAFALVMFVILMVIPSASAEDHDVSITDDMKFNPEDLTINVGDTVNWTNNDGMGHTANSTDGPDSFDSGNIAAGATWSFTFTEAGTYNYKCDYHSSMTASITVVESDDGDGSNDTDDEGSDDSDDGDGSNDTEEAPDGDNDGIADDDDDCPEEDASGYDADADGCIDDSDSDGAKDDVDVCPFDANDGCPAALANEETNATVDVPGCVHQSAENYNADATEDDGSCKYDAEDTPGFGVFTAIISCLIIAFRRKRNS